MKGYIYGFLLGDSDVERWYVGQTRRQLFQRWREHRLGSFEPQTKFHCALNTYGWFKFKKVILETLDCQDSEDLALKLSEREMHWIIEKDALNSGFNEASEMQKFKPVVKKRKKELDEAEDLPMVSKRKIIKRCECGLSYPPPNHVCAVQD